jgi:hypothetical protein
MDRNKYLNKIKNSKENEIIEVPFELSPKEISDCFNHILNRKF